MDAPEVRLSPDGNGLAHKFPREKSWTIQRYREFDRFVLDSEVSDWTPLLPVRSPDRHTACTNCDVGGAA